jgi:hypothetical protein
MRTVLGLGVLLAACGANGGGPASPAWEPEAPLAAASPPALAQERDPQGASALPYDQVVQKSSHNSYGRHEPLFDQLVYHRIRSLELDVHRTKGNAGPIAGDWFVYHQDVLFGRRSSCTRLSDCLRQIAAFHAAVPDHEVVTVFVDLKDSFQSGHAPDDLDDALARGLGRDVLVTPRDLLARCPDARTVRDAVAGACAFPSLGELRGKIVVAVTGGSACDRKSRVSAYAGAEPNARLAFAAPNVDARCPVSAIDETPHVVFVNMTAGARARAVEARRRGLVARVYNGGMTGGIAKRSVWEAARAAGAQHLATDRVNVDLDPWTSTDGPGGFPFACEGCEAMRERAPLLPIRVASGDFWGAKDSGWFAHDEDSGTSVWTSFVSVPSSHVEPYAKACLMARASEDPRSANVAVCRTFDGHPPRAQVRASHGGKTYARSMKATPGTSAEAAAFLRLSVTPRGARSDVVAEASIDGVAWTTLLQRTLDGSLPRRGLAVSSHGRGPVRAVFGAITRERRGALEAIDAAKLPLRSAIGARAVGRIDEGQAR